MHQKGSVTPRNSKMLKDSSVPRANVTPNQTTPKTHKNLCLKKTESPASPLASPSPSQHAMVIHKMFGSPEVEVSWDWGCSQLVNQIGMYRCIVLIKVNQYNLKAKETVFILSIFGGFWKFKNYVNYSNLRLVSIYLFLLSL